MQLGAGIVGAVASYYLKQYRTDYLANKDAMFRHYIQLHPESFEAPGLYRKIFKQSIQVYLLGIYINAVLTPNRFFFLLICLFLC